MYTQYNLISFNTGALTPLSFDRIRTLSEGTNEEFEYQYTYGK